MQRRNLRRCDKSDELQFVVPAMPGPVEVNSLMLHLLIPDDKLKFVGHPRFVEVTIPRTTN